MNRMVRAELGRAERTEAPKSDSHGHRVSALSDRLDGVFAAIAGAILLWHLVEKPAMRLKGSRAKSSGTRHWSDVPKADSA